MTFVRKYKFINVVVIYRLTVVKYGISTRIKNMVTHVRLNITQQITTTKQLYREKLATSFTPSYS